MTHLLATTKYKVQRDKIFRGSIVSIGLPTNSEKVGNNQSRELIARDGWLRTNQEQS